MTTRHHHARILCGAVSACIAVAATSGVLVGVAAATPASNCVTTTVVTCTYGFTGATQTFTVPAGVTSITVQANGAAGAAGSNDDPDSGVVPGAGGKGARVEATLAVTPGQVFPLTVGGKGNGATGGFNGGGQGGENFRGALTGNGGQGGGGGGGTDVRRIEWQEGCSCEVAVSLVVAGGGGGGSSNTFGSSSISADGGAGGDGGLNGENGRVGRYPTDDLPGTFGFGAIGGAVGSADGGAGGAAANQNSSPGSNGRLGQGGNGGSAISCDCLAPGGGGGGWFGGGGAGYNAGGGGGSSTGPDGAVYTTGANSGDGSIVITYVPDPAPTVTVNQAADQMDPSIISAGSSFYDGSVSFTVAFSEPVTGFTATDVLIGGTAPVGPVTVTGGPTVYTATVKAAAAGTVNASVNFGSAIDAAGNGNIASESTDNEVTVQVNEPWITFDDTYTIPEDTPLRVDGPGVFANDTNPSGGTVFNIDLASIPAEASGFVAISDGGFRYTPAKDFNGNDSWSYRIENIGLTSNVSTVNIIITPVNDAPSFTKGADQTIDEDAGPQTVPGWATNISPGPANENTQTVTFTTTNTNASLFSAAPAVSATGQLTYTPAPNANGTATVTVTAKDNGGTTNGGIDTSASATFTITVRPVDDPATITVARGGVCNADFSGTVNLALSDPDSPADAITITGTSNATSIVANSGIRSSGTGSTRTLRITGTGRAGTATITVTARDGSGNLSTLTLTYIAGTNKENRLTGTTGTDLLFGANDEDIIDGRAGNDLICGGNDEDRLTGGPGDDTIDGGRGRDRLTDREPADTVVSVP